MQNSANKIAEQLVAATDCLFKLGCHISAISRDWWSSLPGGIAGLELVRKLCCTACNCFISSGQATEALCWRTAPNAAEVAGQMYDSLLAKHAEIKVML